MDKTSLSLFEELANMQPDITALISPRGILDYSTLNASSNKLAKHLQAQGVGKEKVVGVRLPRGINHVVSMLAIWKAGGAYLPLPLSLPQDRLNFTLNDSNAHCVISMEAIMNDECTFAPPRTTSIILDDPACIKKLKEYSSENLPCRTTHNQLAYIIYTSGSTGSPKGVAITHGSLLNTANEHRYSREVQKGDRVMVFSPYFFDASLRDIVGALVTGASLYLPERDEVMPGNLIRTLREHEITYVVVTPSALRNCPYEELPSLKTLVLAGEAVDSDLIRKWGPGRVIINAYGPTEATVCCAKRVYPSGEFETGMVVSIGMPTLNMKIYILDSERRPKDKGSVGEIYIGGPGVSQRGYLNRPSLNERSFFPNPFDGGIMFRSGDLGRTLPNGETECLGRCDSQMKLHGQRIDADEIEHWLRSHESVVDAAAVLRGPPGRRVLVAFIIRSGIGNAWLPSKLASHLQNVLLRQLPRYCVPSYIEFLNEWPLSPTNKLLREALPDPSMGSCVAQCQLDAEQESQLSIFEQRVLQVICDALNIKSDTIKDPGTTYTDLGGTSLQVQIVLNHIGSHFGHRIELSAFYNCNQSIREIAQILVADNVQQYDSGFDRDFTGVVSLRHDLSTIQSPRIRHAGGVLITGATGFLGAHILAEILSSENILIACVVRARNSINAYERVMSAMSTWGIWNDSYHGRFEAVVGDISKPLLGIASCTYDRLARQTGTVWHCAAEVNLIATFSHLKAANVDGTMEVLQFANALSQKRVIYISTLATFFGAGNKIECGFERDTKAWSKGIVSGYGQSKWVSEQLVLEYGQQGGSVVILRPGRVLGSAAIGKSPTQDLNIRLLRSFIETSVAPDLEWALDFTPVDLCARAAVRLARETVPSPSNSIFHLINPSSITISQVVELLNSSGYSVRIIPYDEWKQRILQSSQMLPLASFFQTPVSKASGEHRTSFEVLLDTTCFRQSCYDISRTLALLATEQIWSFPFYKVLLVKYLEHIS